MDRGVRWQILDVQLKGGAPWGFTLQGGLEHGQPLLISKVEEGGKAASVEQPLLVGDELIIINFIELSGFRQEAIALVKGSHRTLNITVRRKMGSESLEEDFTVLQTPLDFPNPEEKPCPVQFRSKNRRSDSASRPHSWHSTKLGDGPSEQDLDRMSSARLHSYHASATDLISGLDSPGEGFLMKSGDQYSSSGSLESLEGAQDSLLCPGPSHLHPRPHSSLSSQQLSSARSSSINLLHSKRDSAYSSFSTSLSFPECLGLSSERSFSLESIEHRADGQQNGMQYVRGMHDTTYGLPLEQETSTRISFREKQQGTCYHSSSSASRSADMSSNRHSVGPIWGSGRSSCESLKGAPAPPQRSDSYTTTRQERPNSWSSLEHARSLRSLQKGTWHHSSGSVSSTSVKGSYSAEGQLHTVIEKSPESSPTPRPRQALSTSPPQDFQCTHPGPRSSPVTTAVYPALLWENQDGPHQTSTATVTHNRTPETDSPTAAPHYSQIEPSEQEHPLTRLEMALAEVQRSGGSITNSHNSGPSEMPQAPTRSLSVLEKVSRFEHRECATKQRSLSTRHRSTPQQVRVKSQNTPRGAEDLRNMLEKSTNDARAHRTISYQGGSHATHRSPADPNSTLQRSRSSFNVELTREDPFKDLPWGQVVPELMSSRQESSTNRSYRDSLKDAQPKVLRSPFFRRRDLISTTSSPLPAPLVPPELHPSLDKSDSQLPSVEKRGPKTLPKPQGVVVTPTVLSPHTPKDRFMVSPELRGPNPPTLPCEPPTLPSMPPVGPPPLVRICGRKRLTSEQKKRSFSEPEKMNEIGVKDPKTRALFERKDTSVADRRRMFEQAASSVMDGASCVFGGALRPELLQPSHKAPAQEALLEFVERKCSKKRNDGGQQNSQRPHSAVLEPYNNHTDSMGLLSTSSLLSLQDCAPDPWLFAAEWPLSSPLAPEGDLRSFQSNVFYPGRVTSPRPPAQQPPSSPPVSRGSFYSTDSGLSLCKDVHQPPPISQNLSQQLDSALQRAGSGRSASAEDLLERTEERLMAPQHCRSHSSPTVDHLDQDVRMIGGFISEAGRSAMAAQRPADIHMKTSYKPLSPLLPVSSNTGLFVVPVLRQEQSRTSECAQLVHSASSLAASVGLPCPMSDSGTPEWTFPGQRSPNNRNETLPTNRNETSPANNTSATRRNDKYSPCSDSALNHNQYRGRTFSLGTKQLNETRSTGVDNEIWCVPFIERQLSSLRTSESNLQLDLPFVDQTDKYDEVFIQSPASFMGQQLISEAEIIEDFPLPPSPILLEADTWNSPFSASNITVVSSRKMSDASPSSFPSSSPPLSPPPPSVETQTTLPSVLLAPSPDQTTDCLALDYEPLPVRCRGPEELRVQALATELVACDCFLAPLLDTWGKSTVDVLEEIFPKSQLVDKLASKHRGSNQLDDRSQDAADMSLETRLDQHHKSLVSRKVELCEAFRNCIAALQKEKEALGNELRAHTELENRVGVWIQEHCKSNEREKYSMFIGDLERVVNLLLSLCGRMARIDRSLVSLQREEPTEDTAELRDSLLHKRNQLLRQTDDALELKDNLERRQRIVHAFVRSSLDQSQLQDYRRLVRTKPSLLIGQRRLDDIIQQLEDQLSGLVDTLPLELTEARGWSRTGLVPPPCATSFLQTHPPSNSQGPAHISIGPVHMPRSTTVTSL